MDQVSGCQAKHLITHFIEKMLSLMLINIEARSGFIRMGGGIWPAVGPEGQWVLKEYHVGNLGQLESLYSGSLSHAGAM
jgi:hypothetical protein